MAKKINVERHKSVAEETLIENINKLPEHKRELDSDVFQAILTAMEEYKEFIYDLHDIWEEDRRI